MDASGRAASKAVGSKTEINRIEFKEQSSKVTRTRRKPRPSCQADHRGSFHYSVRSCRAYTHHGDSVSPAKEISG